MPEYFIVSVLHNRAHHRFITLWRPDDCGYAFPLSWSGRYSQECIMAKLGYYNNGENIAVPCELIESLSVPNTWPREIDNDAGPLLLNTRANWNQIMSAAIAPLTYPEKNRPKPKPFRERSHKKAIPC